MNISKLSRFLSAPSQVASNPIAQNVNGEAGSAGTETTEAVKLASDFGRRTDDATASDRQKRVEDLKAQVAQGTYRPDSQKVAESLVQELFF